MWRRNWRWASKQALRQWGSPFCLLARAERIRNKRDSDNKTGLAHEEAPCGGCFHGSPHISDFAIVRLAGHVRVFIENLTATFSFPFILCLPTSDCLPLHVTRIVQAAARERFYMVDHISRA